MYYGHVMISLCKKAMRMLAMTGDMHEMPRISFEYVLVYAAGIDLAWSRLRYSNQIGKLFLNLCIERGRTVRVDRKVLNAEHHLPFFVTFPKVEKFLSNNAKEKGLQNYVRRRHRPCVHFISWEGPWRISNFKIPFDRSVLQHTFLNFNKHHSRKENKSPGNFAYTCQTCARIDPIRKNSRITKETGENKTLTFIGSIHNYLFDSISASLRLADSRADARSLHAETIIRGHISDHRTCDPHSICKKRKAKKLKQKNWKHENRWRTLCRGRGLPAQKRRKKTNENWIIEFNLLYHLFFSFRKCDARLDGGVTTARGNRTTRKKGKMRLKLARKLTVDTRASRVSACTSLR